jgi:hypothetical protein
MLTSNLMKYVPILSPCEFAPESDRREAISTTVDCALGYAIHSWDRLRCLVGL